MKGNVDLILKKILISNKNVSIFTFDFQIQENKI